MLPCVPLFMTPYLSMVFILLSLGSIYHFVYRADAEAKNIFGSGGVWWHQLRLPHAATYMLMSIFSLAPTDGMQAHHKLYMGYASAVMLTDVACSVAGNYRQKDEKGLLR
jgi:hypothetical protein